MSTTDQDHAQLDLTVEGMTCGSCSARVQRTLLKQEGVADAEVNFATGQARVTTDGPVDLQAIKAAIGKVGYELQLPDPEPARRPGARARAHGRGDDLWLVFGPGAACAREAGGCPPGGRELRHRGGDGPGRPAGRSVGLVQRDRCCRVRGRRPPPGRRAPSLGPLGAGAGRPGGPGRGRAPATVGAAARAGRGSGALPRRPDARRARGQRPDDAGRRPSRDVRRRDAGPVLRGLAVPARGGEARAAPDREHGHPDRDRDVGRLPVQRLPAGRRRARAVLRGPGRHHRLHRPRAVPRGAGQGAGRPGHPLAARARREGGPARRPGRHRASRAGRGGRHRGHPAGAPGGEDPRRRRGGRRCLRRRRVDAHRRVRARRQAVGSSVAGATINTSGALTIRATSVGADSALARIVRMVEEAQAGKSDMQRLADRVSGVFVPTVLVVAVLTFAGWSLLGGDVSRAIYASVAVLIIACPCALGLATPMATMVGTGRGAQLGILIRSVEVLERARTIDTIVLDKTGTLTRGEMALTDVVAGDTDEATLLARAGAVEADSEHPVGQALADGARERLGRDLPTADGFLATAGMGVEARSTASRSWSAGASSWRTGGWCSHRARGRRDRARGARTHRGLRGVGRRGPRRPGGGGHAQGRCGGDRRPSARARPRGRDDHRRQRPHRRGDRRGGRHRPGAGRGATRGQAGRGRPAPGRGQGGRDGRRRRERRARRWSRPTSGSPSGPGPTSPSSRAT
jgi:copper chaperone CopZ